MKIRLALATSATFGLLLASGCNQAPDTKAENSAVENETLADNAALEAADSNTVAETSSETATSEPAPVATQTVKVVEVPAPAPTAPPAAAAPLNDAASVARRIREGRGVERIPYQGGWAWRENGRIVRTASSDGRRVSYFRPGESNPYFVQDGDRGYAYSGSRIERGYDARGNPVAVDQSRRQRGEELAREAAQDRSRADRNDSDQRRQPGTTDQHREDSSRQGPGPAPRSNDRTDRDRSQSTDRNNGQRGHREPNADGNSASASAPSNSTAPSDRRRRPNDRPND